MPQAIDYESSFQNAVDRVIAFLPDLVLFLVILIVGIFVAKAVQKILTAVLQRVGFDRAVERGGIKQALSRSKYDAATILGKVVYYAIFLIVLSLAFNVFGPNPISDFLTRVVNYLPNVFVALIILVLAASIAAAVKELVSSTLGGLSYGKALANGASLAIIAVGIFAALNQLEIAKTIVNGIFFALLAIIAIPLIIAFGIGGIEPARDQIRTMQSRGQQKKQELQQQLAQQQQAERTQLLEQERARQSETAAAESPTPPARPTRRRVAPPRVET